MIYFLLQREDDVVKIGTSKDAVKRIAQHRCSNPKELEVALMIEGSYKEERELHRYFSASRLHPRSEWFKWSGLVEEWVAEYPEVTTETPDSAPQGKHETFIDLVSRASTVITGLTSVDLYEKLSPEMSDTKPSKILLDMFRK
jgi:hypothetical protein